MEILYTESEGGRNDFKLKEGGSPKGEGCCREGKKVRASEVEKHTQ